MSKRQTTFIPGKPFWVNVRQEHIDAGVRYECEACPLALALRERTGISDLKVGSVSIRSESAGFYIPLPSAAIEWREAFDENVKSYPFKFKLVIPERREANG